MNRYANMINKRYKLFYSAILILKFNELL